jgi:glycosyltransferase domain-containing protein
MASLRARYTLLIPTFNRPAHLRSLLGYLAARRFEYPIRILDSSSGDALLQNRETVGRQGLDIVHEAYDPATSIHGKIGLAVASVDSRYCSICADDDVLFTDEVSELLDVLDSDPSLVVAHGYYMNFKPGEDFEIWHTDYSAPSIVADDALRRIVAQMNDYQAIYYGIHRTTTMRAIQPPLDRVKSLWAKELLSSSLALVAGGAYRAPRYYMARNSSPSIATDGWHPHQFLATEPLALLREYADYRGVTIEHLMADSRCQTSYRPEQIAHVFDLVHLKYFSPMLSPAVMSYLIEESLLPNVTSRQMIDGIWKKFASPYVPEPDGLKEHLARIWAFLRHPSYASGVLHRTRRVVGLYRELRLRAKFDASLSRSWDGIVVRRITRDGGSRRYLVPPGFLHQSLGDGGQVSASHLRNIIDHLDVYV